MRVEAILSKEDLVLLVGQFIPLRVPLGKDGELLVSDPSGITLVPEAGLRVEFKAKLHWPVLGVSVPVTIHSLTVLLRPTVDKRPSGDALVFTVEIEHADLAGVPKIIDSRLVEMVNKELAAKDVELSWNFAGSLSHAFKLPESLEPLDAFELTVTSGQVKVTGDAMGLMVSFHSAVTRHA